MEKLDLSERARKSLRSEWFAKQTKAVRLRAELEVLDATMKGISTMLGGDPVKADEPAEGEAENA